MLRMALLVSCGCIAGANLLGLRAPLLGAGALILHALGLLLDFISECKSVQKNRQNNAHNALKNSTQHHIIRKENPAFKACFTMKQLVDWPILLGRNASADV